MGGELVIMQMDEDARLLAHVRTGNIASVPRRRLERGVASAQRRSSVVDKLIVIIRTDDARRAALG